jgi:tetratricopeptide (TPR) repeat protein
VNPDIKAWMERAAAHCAAGDFRDAADMLHQVLRQDPRHAAAATQLAEIETDHGLYANAVARLLGVLRSRPRFAPALSALARACMMTDRLDEALVHAREACAHEPAEPRHQLQMARVLMRQGQLDAARSILLALAAERERRPEIAGVAHGLLGELLEAEGDPLAVEYFRIAAQLLPGDAAHHMSFGIALLRLGHYAEGWEEYAWRHRTLHLRRQALALPDELQWNGQPLRGQTIVLTDEQGIGDAIQFFRYVPMVASRAPARLIHVAFPVLAPLFRMAAPVAEVLAELPFGTNLNYHSTTMGLARVFRTQPEAIPAAVPYLLPDPARVSDWAPLLTGDVRPRVGLVWSGNPTHQNDRARSIPAELLLQLTTLPGTFFGLQRDIRPSDMAAVTACTGLRSIGVELKDFADTAAAIAGLDLVITVDTAVAHLAGAMGKPVWVLLPRVADWRWLQDREDSPWYPTARLFRSGHDGWGAVLNRVAAALRTFAG